MFKLQQAYGFPMQIIKREICTRNKTSEILVPRPLLFHISIGTFMHQTTAPTVKIGFFVRYPANLRKSLDSYFMPAWGALFLKTARYSDYIMGQ